MTSFKPRKPQALAWIDIETTGLPPNDDPLNYSGVVPLEIAVILTDFDLEEFGGYTALLHPTKEAVAALAVPANAGAKQMHVESGLIAALKAAAAAGETETIAEAEANIIRTLSTRTTYEPGEFMIAGSGVATYDFNVLKHWMPKLASWFAYYPFDIGVVRRAGRILSGGRDLVNPTTHSYGDLKVHRALADVKAHLDEAREWQSYFRAPNGG